MSSFFKMKPASLIVAALLPAAVIACSNKTCDAKCQTNPIHTLPAGTSQIMSIELCKESQDLVFDRVDVISTDERGIKIIYVDQAYNQTMVRPRCYQAITQIGKPAYNLSLSQIQVGCEDSNAECSFRFDPHFECITRSIWATPEPTPSPTPTPTRSEAPSATGAVLSVISIVIAMLSA